MTDPETSEQAQDPAPVEEAQVGDKGDAADVKDSETEAAEEDKADGDNASKEEEDKTGAAAEDVKGEEEDVPSEAPVEGKGGDGESTVDPTPKKRRGRPPKSKTPQSATTPTSTATTPSSPKSKRKTPQSAFSPQSSSKRERKSAAAFEPDNFKADRLAAQESKQCPPGLGVALSSLDKVKANIQKLISKEDPVITSLYKFIFSTMGLTAKGKPSKKHIKSMLMDFSGFLSAKKEGENMEVDEEGKKDGELKEKFESKATDLSDAQIKAFIDILHLERPINSSKKEKVDILVGFLAVPSESLLAKSSIAEAVEEVIAKSTETRKKRGRPPKNQTESPKPAAKRGRGRPKKTKIDGEDPHEDQVSAEGEVEGKVNEDDDQHELDDDTDEIVDGETFPSARKLRTWVKAYVTCFDLDKCNAKHAISTASEKFKVDLNVKKDILMEMLKDAISA